MDEFIDSHVNKEKGKRRTGYQVLSSRSLKCLMALVAEGNNFEVLSVGLGLQVPSSRWHANCVTLFHFPCLQCSASLRLLQSSRRTMRAAFPVLKDHVR